MADEPRLLKTDYASLPPCDDTEFLTDEELADILAKEQEEVDAYIKEHPAEVKLARVVVPPYMRVREGHVEQVSGYTYNREGGRVIGKLVVPIREGGRVTGGKVVVPAKGTVRPVLDVEDYGGQHQPNPDGPRAFDLTEGGFVDADIYEHPEHYGIATGSDDFAQATRESIAVLQMLRGNPAKQVTVYRAAPPGIDKIEPGNWVTLSPLYARLHAMQSEDPSEDWPVISTVVRADEVRWAGDDLNEFGYFPDRGEHFAVTAEVRSGGLQSLGDRWELEKEARLHIDARLAQFKDGDPIFILGHGPGIFHTASKNMSGQRLGLASVEWHSPTGKTIKGQIDPITIVSPNADVTIGYVEDTKYAKRRIHDAEGRPSQPAEYEINPKSIRYHAAARSSDGGLFVGARKKKVADAKRAAKILPLPAHQKPTLPPPKRSAEAAPVITSEEYRRRYSVSPRGQEPVLEWKQNEGTFGVWHSEWNGWRFTVIQRAPTLYEVTARPPADTKYTVTRGQAHSLRRAQVMLEKSAAAIESKEALRKSPLTNAPFPAFTDVVKQGKVPQFTSFLSQVSKYGVPEVARRMGWTEQHVLDALVLGGEHYKTYQGGKFVRKYQEVRDVLAKIGYQQEGALVPAKTLAEAKEQAERLFPDRDVDLDTWNVEVANEFLQTMDKLFREYPTVANQIRLLGSSSFARSVMPIRGRQKGAYAWALRGNEGMGARPSLIMQDSRARDLNGTMKKVKRDVLAGFHPAGTGSIPGLLTHEFGHFVHWALVKNPQWAIELQAALDNAVRDWYRARHGAIGVMPPLMPPMDVARASVFSQISYYASQNASEFFGEAFADWVMNGDRAHPVSQVLGRFVDQHLKAGVMPT